MNQCHKKGSYKYYFKPRIQYKSTIYSLTFYFIAGSEARLLDSLNNTTIPMWWDDIDSLVILEKMTVLLYNKVL